MEELTIKKGKHFEKMSDRIIKYRNAPTKVSWKYIFQENSNYDHGTIVHMSFLFFIIEKSVDR